MGFYYYRVMVRFDHQLPILADDGRGAPGADGRCGRGSRPLLPPSARHRGAHEVSVVWYTSTYRWR